VRSKPGKFEICNHGTLFLDEIGEMPPALQAKLLHVLQDREFSRLGGSSRVKVNVRVLAATNVNVREAIAAKTFREDLYYRLSTFVFTLPPLRDRPEDIPILLQRNLNVFAERLRLPPRPISNHMLERCLRYNWPGNVRELENFVKRYLICGEEAMTMGASLRMNERDRTVHPVQPAVPGAGDLKAHIRELRNGAEASAVYQALEEKNWNRKQAAKSLNISYKSLLSKIRLYGLDQGAKVESLPKGSAIITNSPTAPVYRARCAGEPL
jgi:transcriptional regulator with PAS, ATPase and Fis domain